MWKNCDVQPFLLLATAPDLRLLFRTLFIAGLDLLSLLNAGIALPRLIAQVHYVHVSNFFSHNPTTHAVYRAVAFCS